MEDSANKISQNENDDSVFCTGRAQKSEIWPMMQAAKEKLRLTIENQSRGKKNCMRDPVCTPSLLPFATTGSKLRGYSLCSDESNLELDFEDDGDEFEFDPTEHSRRVQYVNIDSDDDNSDAISDCSASSESSRLLFCFISLKSSGVVL